MRAGLEGAGAKQRLFPHLLGALPAANGRATGADDDDNRKSCERQRRGNILLWCLGRLGRRKGEKTREDKRSELAASKTDFGAARSKFTDEKPGQNVQSEEVGKAGKKQSFLARLKSLGKTKEPPQQHNIDETGREKSRFTSLLKSVCKRKQQDSEAAESIDGKNKKGGFLTRLKSLGKRGERNQAAGKKDVGTVATHFVTRFNSIEEKWEKAMS